MPSLSERAEFFAQSGDASRGIFIKQMCQAIEAITEANHALAAKQEASELRIEELEAQVTALAPPKSAGPVVVPAWKKLSESDLLAEE